MTPPEETERIEEIEEVEAEEVAVEVREADGEMTSQEKRDKTPSRVSRRLKRSSPRYEREDFFEVLKGLICGFQWTGSENLR